MIRIFKEKFIFVMFTLMIVLSSLSDVPDSNIYFALPTIFFVLFIIYLCDESNTNNKYANIYLIMFFVIIISSIFLVVSRLQGFIGWFLYQYNDAKTPLYFTLFFVLCCFFLTSSIYYFSYVSFQPAMLVLLLIFPCLVKIQQAAEITFLNKITLIILFILLLASLNIKSKADSPLNNFKKPLLYLFTTFTIILVVGMVSFAPYILKVEHETGFDIRDNIKNMGFDPTELLPIDKSSTSGGANLRPSQEILYYVKVNSSNPFFLNRQVFGDYQSDRYWTAVSGNYLNDNAPLTDLLDYESLNLNKFFELINKLPIEIIEEGHPLQKLKNGFDSDFLNLENSTSAKITIENGTGKSVLATDKTFNITSSTSLEVYGNPLREFTNNSNQSLKRGNSYEIFFYDDSPLNNNKFRELVKNFSSEEFYEIITELTYLVDMNADTLGEYREVVYAFDGLCTDAASFNERYGKASTTSEVTDLASRITKDFTSEYEKAVALENFFEEENFSYDLNVKPISTTDFLFNEKTGTCSDYATAMVVMAKSVGLNARYVEGFAVYENSMVENYDYVVRMSHSHAYAQVFIPMYGWRTFDPTVSGYSVTAPVDIPQENNILSLKDTVSRIFFAITLMIIIGSVIYILIKVVFKNKITRFILNISPNNKSISIIFNKLKGYTKNDFENKNISSSNLKKYFMVKHKFDIGFITSLYENVQYNDAVCSKEDKSKCIDLYFEFLSHYKMQDSKNK